MRVVSSVHPANFGLLRGAEPVRRIAPRTDRPSMPGWFPTAKGTLRSLRTESLLELDGLEQFEINPDCVLMAAQPHHLVYFEPRPDGSTIRRVYTPDLAVLMADGAVAIVDFKVARYAARAEWRRLEALLVEAYRTDHGVSFSTVTDAMVRLEPRRANARIMMMHRPVVRDQEAEAALDVAIERIGLPAPLGVLTRACGLTNPRPEVDRAFSTLIGFALRGRVSLDLGVRLGPETLVSARTPVEASAA